MCALGREALPPHFRLGTVEYRLERTYKHDFFAATGLYSAGRERVVLKLGRRASCWGFPLHWLGRWLCRREVAVYEAAAGIEGIPALVGRLGDTGLVHVFVPGHPLQPGERVGDDFFERLHGIIAGLHLRRIAYADLEKRENIIVAEDGRPTLIDFQISWHWPGSRHGVTRWIPDFLGRRLFESLCAADMHHLGKHRRRHRPDQLDAQELAATRMRPRSLQVYRSIARPITWVRRGLLFLFTGAARSAKQEGPEFLHPHGARDPSGGDAGPRDEA
jgi:hypothetical protein